MNVLVVVSLSSNSGGLSPFVKAQTDSLKKLGVNFSFFYIKGKGHTGYLSNLRGLYKSIKSFKPDLIHAHYGLSGLLSCLQFNAPLIVTFHGSDINLKKNRKYSTIASKLSSENIFVHPDLPEKLNYNKDKVNIIPCGVDLNRFYPFEKESARNSLGLSLKKNYALFSSTFDKEVKNYPLAKDALNRSDKDIELIELKGYKPEEVNLLMNAVDFVLVTSKSETGPLVVKEAMACNTPVVSTDVGDVKQITNDLGGYFICNDNPEDVKNKINEAYQFLNKQPKTQGRARLKNMNLDLDSVARSVFEIYKKEIDSFNKN